MKHQRLPMTKVLHDKKDSRQPCGWLRVYDIRLNVVHLAPVYNFPRGLVLYPTREAAEAVSAV